MDGASVNHKQSATVKIWKNDQKEGKSSGKLPDMILPEQHESQIMSLS
jgi:hypothetical protein